MEDTSGTSYTSKPELCMMQTAVAKEQFATTTKSALADTMQSDTAARFACHASVLTQLGSYYGITWLLDCCMRGEAGLLLCIETAVPNNRNTKHNSP
jgi:hypothetical protein